MHIALVIERIETWRGGAETSTVHFANELAAQGCSVTVLTTSHAPSTPTLTIVPIPARATFRAWRTRRFAEGAARYAREHDFDLVHAITPCPAADVYQPRGGTVPEMLERNLAMRAGALQRGAKRLGQKLSAKYRVIADLERSLLNRDPAPWVIALSDYVSEQLRRHYRFDPARVRKVFNGVAPDPTPPEERAMRCREVRRQFDIGEKDLFVLCVAHNFKLKGVGKLIEALPGVSVPGRRVVAVIVGRDDPTPFARLAVGLGVAGRVLFAGPSQRVRSFFHAADLLAHPTFYDPCSRVVLEAMASGLPVITTRFNGAAERVTDGREGYVIDAPTDVDALADRITRLADPDHRRDCARRAPEAVRDATMTRHAAEVIALYDQILSAGHGRVGGLA